MQKVQRYHKMATTCVTPLQSATATLSSSQFSALQQNHSESSGPDWYLIDANLRSKLGPVSCAMNSNEINTCEAAESFTTILEEHLSNYNIIKKQTPRCPS